MIGRAAPRSLRATVEKGLTTRPANVGFRRVHWTVIVGGGFFALICSGLVLTPWIAPFDPNEQVLHEVLQWPSGRHWLGTDILGRDVLSRLMFGGRFSITIAGITLIGSSTFGIAVGALSARLGGFVDEAAMRIVDVLMAFPDLLLALVLVALIGAGPVTVVIALSLVGWTPFARLTRSVALDINTKGYIEAARALGCLSLIHI